MKDRIGTVSKQECALQGGNRSIDGPDRREWPEVVAFAFTGTAVFDDLRKIMVAGNQDIGKRLIVSQ